MSASDESFERLRTDLRIARERYQQARSDAQDLLKDGIPTDLAHPDGVLHIRQVLQQETDAWRAYCDCLQRLNRFAIDSPPRDEAKQPKSEIDH